MTERLPERWHHQTAAFDFAIERFLRKLYGVMLAMVMGAGKTRVACELALAQDARQMLIVCPLRVVDVWMAQLARFAPAYRPVPLGDGIDGGARKLTEARRWLAWSDERPLVRRLALIINYDSARIQPFAGWSAARPWDMVIADECVPAGTMINTPEGHRPIETLKTGDAVLGFDHQQQRLVKTTVTATFQNFNTGPKYSVGQTTMTSEHPVWTESQGYLPVSQLRKEHYGVRLIDDQLRVVPLRVSKTTPEPGQILQSKMLSAMAHVAPGICEDAQHGTQARVIPQANEEVARETGRTAKTYCPSRLRPQPDQKPGEQAEGDGSATSHGLPDADRRQWSRPDNTTANALSGASRLRNGIPDSDWMQTGLPESGSCASGDSLGNRGGRPQPPSIEGQAAGSKEGRDSRPARMDRYSILELANPQPSVICDDFDPNRYRVFNVETGTGNYFANGLLVHNCHRIKEPRGRTSLYMARLGQVARRRLGLTGTPMPHEPTDIWGQFRFLDHTHLDPTFAQFKMRYAVMGGYFDKQVKSWKDLDDLERRFRELAYRVDESVLDLPPEMDEVRWASLSPDGQRIYAAMERDMIAWISESAFVTAANAMVKLTRLQQITSGWAPDESRTLKPVDRAKEDLLEELLEDLREPVVVFCRFKSDLEAVHRVAAKLQLGSLELSGDKDELTGWQKQPGWPYVLAAQIDSGSEGVDMTRARVAIYYSIGFRLDKYLQSRARIRRPPQQRPCLFIHLQARGTVDEYVLHAVEARRDLVDSVLQELKTKGAVHALA
jgi:superfamily II DNA or RNA helicase